MKLALTSNLVTSDFQHGTTPNAELEEEPTVPGLDPISKLLLKAKQKPTFKTDPF